MSCGCDNKKRMQDLSRVRDLAKKAAKMEGVVYVIYERGGEYVFVREGEKYIGNFVEYIWFI